MNIEAMFEEASRNKVKFNCKGLCSSEDLWDLPTTTKKKDVVSLKGLYTNLAKELKEFQEERTLCEESIDEDIPGTSRKSKEEKTVELKMAIVKHIYNTLKKEEKKKEEAKERATLKQKLLGKLADQEDKKYDDMSPEDIKKIIDDL